MVLAPVVEPQEKRGEDARTANLRNKEALRACNARLVNSRAIYEGVRKLYAGE
ncbi:MAG: hypothetical protein AB7U62_03070 [Pseudolabrys sp.]